MCIAFFSSPPLARHLPFFPFREEQVILPFFLPNTSTSPLALPPFFSLFDTPPRRRFLFFFLVERVPARRPCVFPTNPALLSPSTPDFVFFFSTGRGVCFFPAASLLISLSRVLFVNVRLLEVPPSTVGLSRHPLYSPAFLGPRLFRPMLLAPSPPVTERLSTAPFAQAISYRQRS